MHRTGREGHREQVGGGHVLRVGGHYLHPGGTARAARHLADERVRRRVEAQPRRDVGAADLIGGERHLQTEGVAEGIAGKDQIDGLVKWVRSLKK